MELFNTLIEYDKQLLIYLHSYSSPFWDGFWLFITNPLHWIPLFLLLFILGFRIFGLKKALLIGLFTILSALSSLIAVYLIKNSIQRLRPINDLSINPNIRILIEDNEFSFISGHAAFSFTIAFLSYWVLKKHYTFAFTIFAFPLLFAYSRIYLAVHYPLDIIFGMFVGYIFAAIFYKIAKKYLNKNTII